MHGEPMQARPMREMEDSGPKPPTFKRKKELNQIGVSLAEIIESTLSDNRVNDHHERRIVFQTMMGLVDRNY